MVPLEKVEGIGKISAQKLSWAGIESTDALLERGATRRGRQVIAGETGLSSKRILEWVNHVDLFRIKGVGEEYAELLEEVGVKNMMELAHSSPENLAERIAQVNEARNLVRRQPSLKVVKRWVKEAQKLPKIVEF
jgi:predicted flap endonuclease-1-like 5' DNA nuclease